MPIFYKTQQAYAYILEDLAWSQVNQMTQDLLNVHCNSHHLYFIRPGTLVSAELALSNGQFTFFKNSGSTRLSDMSALVIYPSTVFLSDFRSKNPNSFPDWKDWISTRVPFTSRFWWKTFLVPYNFAINQPLVQSSLLMMTKVKYHCDNSCYSDNDPNIVPQSEKLNKK